MNKEIFYLKIKIIINQNLYKKNCIDEETFLKANDILLKRLKILEEK
ncbi:MAG: hypothetical protein J6D28_06030 [Bacilli bacterium]|nr:hypothetical protein [Bacilli bacterium]